LPPSPDFKLSSACTLAARLPMSAIRQGLLDTVQLLLSTKPQRAV
jgi:hypothetical protein